MNKKIVIGNWKMNPVSLEEAKKVFSGLKRVAKGFKTTLVVCPPFIFLSAINNRQSAVKLGAQNLSKEDPQSGSRAFTGEISASMLKEVGAEYVILGHSERREIGETDEIVNQKLKTALKAQLTPVVCIGEKERDHDGHFFESLREQIKSTFSRMKKGELGETIIAYEPVWAIGKSDKDNMKGEDLHQMVIFVRKVLTEMYGKPEAFSPRIIYGGSVSSSNVEDIVGQGQVDGILPGRASLDPLEIKGILEVLEKI